MGVDERGNGTVSVWQGRWFSSKGEWKDAFGKVADEGEIKHERVGSRSGSLASDQRSHKGTDTSRRERKLAGCVSKGA